jgi:hypothetical protein
MPSNFEGDVGIDDALAYLLGLEGRRVVLSIYAETPGSLTQIVGPLSFVGDDRLPDTQDPGIALRVGEDGVFFAYPEAAQRCEVWTFSGQSFFSLAFHYPGASLVLSDDAIRRRLGPGPR